MRSFRWLIFYMLMMSCAEPSITALDITFKSDPTLGDEGILTQKIQRLRIIFDAAEGLYPRDFKKKTENYTIEDIDGDQYAELIAEFELKNDQRLPTVRLEQGGLPSAALDVKVEGIGRY